MSSPLLSEPTLRTLPRPADAPGPSESSPVIEPQTTSPPTTSTSSPIPKTFPRWTKDEETEIERVVGFHTTNSRDIAWESVAAQFFPTRSPKALRARWITLRGW